MAAKWHGWEDRGGPIFSAPAVASWGVDRLDVFAAGSDGKLMHMWHEGNTWHDWQPLGGTFKGGPAAVSWGPHRIDVFVRGMNDHLWHKWFDTHTWHNWQDLGGQLTSSPAVASWGPHRLDVFAAGSDGQLVHKWHEGNTWHDWQTLGGTFRGAPAAVSWGTQRIDVFVQGIDGNIGHLLWDSKHNKHEWIGWEDLSINSTYSPPAVASWTPGRLDVFYAKHSEYWDIINDPFGESPSSRELVRVWWDSSPGTEYDFDYSHDKQWNGPDMLGGQFYDNPAAVSSNLNQIDVFVRGGDGHLGHMWWS